ncbi:S-layer homology domain-containing protein [Paenibacillus doosanensis]|uniref:S-layer protein sap n=1 Tax=Paenibacillus konkukensis TaxID=2020716 RepID=A0ABY4RI67_9BACL|nr:MULTISPECIES: S-layer homology domain-containing protein [Paenibacillus]MCS7462520.1 S-layer homology domain-containing protein [Paenibacillus doosanensis]UQZ81873.1 S-layer protein sap precursor [Paenibacillus konkukensis]
MNNKYKHSKKMAAGIIALSVLVASPVYAADTVTKTSATSSTTTAFTDVSSDHWAIKHITKLAALGIIQGVDKGKFSPDTQVSRQDVVIMAIRMMGLENEALKNKSETILPVTVDSYAKPYIAYAFDKGLITVDEEADTNGSGSAGSKASGSDNAKSKTAWGSSPASREWVCKLVIRAIDKQDLADKKSADSSIFQDAKDMSSWAVGYINAAVSLEIVNGVDDNNFDPKGNVTRAQMATFLSRADKELTTHSERVAIGYMMDLKDRKITVMDKQGKTSEYTLASDTVFYKGDSRIPSSDIKETNEVYVIQDRGTASYIELTNDTEQMETYEGTLEQLYVSKMMVSVSQGGTEDLKDLAENVTVTDSDGRGLSLSSIPVGSIIQLKRNLLIPNSKYSKIVVKQVPISKTSEGTIVSIDADQNTITFLEKTSGENESFPISVKLAVTLPGNATGDLSKLRVGDIVSYDIKNNQITGVKVSKQADIGSAVEGTLTSVSDDKKILTINKPDNTLGAFYIDDNAVVSIDGLGTAGFFDLELGDKLKLDLVNEKVVKVTVTSRGVTQLSFARIVNYDAENKLLTVTDENGTPYAYKMTETTGISYWDAPMNLDDFTSKFTKTKGTKVDLKVSKDKVVSIKYAKDAEGAVSQVNASTGQITIRTAGGQNVTFGITASVPVETLAIANATISDVKIGDNIVGSLNRDQDTIMSIAIKKTAVYKTQITDNKERQVSVKDSSGGKLTFVIDNNDKILNPGKATHSFEDIAIDEYMKVAYTGKKLESVELLTANRGKVTAVDTASGTITVQDYTAGVQTITVGKQFSVNIGGAASADLASVKVNDRVEVVKGDQTIITVAAASKRKVQAYDSVLNLMQLKAGVSGDKTTYTLYSKAYLHQGASAVAAGSFAENDDVTIYVLDDKIYEMEK